MARRAGQVLACLPGITDEAPLQQCQMRPFVHSTIQTTCARGATEGLADWWSISTMSIER